MHDAKENQHIGFLATALKNLAGELKIPVITAIQINRSGVDKDVINTGMIADSDRVVRYANTILGLTRKDQEDIENDGIMRGNGRLQILDTRAGTHCDWDGIDLNIIHKVITVRPTGTTFKLSELMPAPRARRSEERS